MGSKETLSRIAETGLTVGSLYAIYRLLTAAFSTDQKDWFKKRDNGQCMFPVDYDDKTYHPCGRTDHLQIHHISPQRYSRDNLNWTDEQIDAAENGITLCEDHHQNVIHGEDMALARANYHADKGSFKKAFSNRDQLVREGKKYWNDFWDSVLLRIAASRTNRFDEPFPKVTKRIRK